MYQLQQQGEKTNQILQQIDSAMQENGQKLDDVISEQQNTNNKLDDIMNNTVPPDTPSGSDKVDDLDDAEAGLRDDSADGLNQGLDVLDSTLDALLTYSFAFYALGSIFNLFFNIPFFNALVYFAFALGILASILGIIKESSSAFGSGTSRGRYSKQNVKARNREKTRGGKK